jgi:hypothetical protein
VPPRSSLNPASPDHGETHSLVQEALMSNPNNTDANPNDPNAQEERSYFSRVLENDATKRGAAAAVAGLVVAAVSEALWGSK